MAKENDIFADFNIKIKNANKQEEDAVYERYSL